MGAGLLPDNVLWSSKPDDCVWARYDDDFVVFHRPSGKTHLMNPAGYMLITEILSDPASASTIAARLANNGSDGAVDQVALSDMLLRFEHLGLVSRSVSAS
jgi:PqqD family protein of HPr-rel-A system